MSILSFGSSSRQPNQTSYIKTFQINMELPTWVIANLNNMKVLTPTIKKEDVYLQKDLYIDGNIINLSDERFKKNINDLPETTNDLLMHVKPRQYEFKDKQNIGIHYGFIAQELEELFPSLVKKSINSDTKSEVKAINYLEFIPLLLMKVQDLQKQIDVLHSNQLNSNHLNSNHLNL